MGFCVEPLIILYQSQWSTCFTCQPAGGQNTLLKSLWIFQHFNILSVLRCCCLLLPQGYTQTHTRHFCLSHLLDPPSTYPVSAQSSAQGVIQLSYAECESWLVVFYEPSFQSFLWGLGVSAFLSKTGTPWRQCAENGAFPPQITNQGPLLFLWVSLCYV